MNKHVELEAAPSTAAAAGVALPILLGLGFMHHLNDMMQSLLAAIYPLIKEAYRLDFGQIGLITLTFQVAASVLQPLVGMYTDRKPQPYSVPAGMAFTFVGLIVLANAGSYAVLLVAAALIGTGSSIFHPEATRMVRLASPGRAGFGQALFQLGGQTGGALGPLLAAFIVVPRGQASLAWFSLAALLGMLVAAWVGRWYGRRLLQPRPVRLSGAPREARPPRKGVALAITVLMILMLSKTAYSASFNSFYTFYLIDRFGVSVSMSQVLLFTFLVSSALGSLIGGHLGDRFGRRKIIWFSILGALPFTLALPHVGLAWTVALTVVIALVMSSAFPSILIYAMDLLPHRLGMIAGLFYGVSFGLGGLSAALLGELADAMSISVVYQVCAYLPLIGLLTWFLPDIRREAAP